MAVQFLDLLVIWAENSPDPPAAVVLLFWLDFSPYQYHTANKNISPENPALVTIIALHSANESLKRSDCTALLLMMTQHKIKERELYS